MYAPRGSKPKESILSKYAKHLGISAIVIAALVVLVIILILWWLYGYHYVIVPVGEQSFEAAVNATLPP